MKKEKFYDIVKRLQKENTGYILLVRSGIFYCAVGKDAVVVNKILNYKPICLKEKICKCGIPIGTIKSIIPILIETGYSYIIYDYDKNTKIAEEIYRIEGNFVEENKENMGCENCWYYKNRDKNINEYVEELKTLMEKENGK